MAYSEEVLNAARERLAREQREREETYRANLADAYERFPRLKEIDNSLRGTMAEVVAAAFRSGEDPQQAIAAVQKKNRELQQEREWLIESNELEDLLDDTPVCTVCGGRGYVGSTMCECLRSLCQQEQKKAISVLIGTGHERFSSFRLDYYSDTIDPAVGASPRRIMSDNLEDCRHYASTFSHRSGNLLFTGGTGLGKTFLSGCIARVVADRGFSVVYDTVVRIISEYETVKFGDNTEDNRRNLDKYRTCDLLIIDDLGTEMLTQFSMSAIYTVLNDRLLAEKPTIVSTNLDAKELRSRYSPQISSRLLGSFELMYFYGDDIRLRGKL